MYIKNAIISLLLYICLTVSAQSQKIPSDIQKSLDSLRDETLKGLEICRIDRQSANIASGLIQWLFWDNMRERILKANIKLNIGMIYDESMRNRVLQLLKNEYRPDELDSLVNKYTLTGKEGRERKAMEICKFDTTILFKSALDSLYNEEKRLHPQDYTYKQFYKYTVFKILKLDTLSRFKNVLHKVLTEEKDYARSYYLGNDNYESLNWVAELCGYINDKRFIKPLIVALDKPNNFQRQSVINSLAMMKVEPYYSNLLKENTISIKEIEAGKVIDYTILTEILRSQESFLELSKYLKSEKECRIIDTYPEENQRWHGDALKFCIFETIYNNLENKDLKNDFGNGSDKIHIPYPTPPEYDDLIEKLYNWMQKNYGKYQISWYHY